MANTHGPTRTRIISEAIQLVQESGLAQLTMRTLADRVHVKAPSLYKHISDRDELVAVIQAHAMESLFNSFPTDPDSIGDVARTYRTWAIDNSHLYDAVFGHPLLRDRIDSGLESEMVDKVMSLVKGTHEKARASWALLHGLVDLELTNRFPDDADLEMTWAHAISMLETT